MSRSRSLNKVMLIGNLTRDPELKEGANGNSLCTFRMATNSSWKSSDGTIKERAEFHNIVCWNKLAEISHKLLRAKMLVYVEGEIRTRRWEDQNGEQRSATEIKMLDMEILNRSNVNTSIEEEDLSVEIDDEHLSDDVEEEDNLF